MCGICGIFNYADVGFEITENLIQKMRDTMVHRGPDGAGVYISANGKAGLGHRRLSIIDLSAAGHQPMSNEDGTVWISFNGEIYNFKELANELEKKGHRFKSRTDTEVIIHLYEELGDNLIHKLRGMFAFAIWDSVKERVLLVRDRIGIKPLYYTFQNGQLIFASEIKAILMHPKVSRVLNEEAFYHYLTFVASPAPLTLFKGIYKLPAGCYLTVDASGNVKQQQYWDVAHIITNSPRELFPEAYYMEKLKELLMDSIKAQMMSDVPFGVFLSGGVDSSTNVALMAELMDRPVETFSVGFKEESEFNEFRYARKVAKRFNTNHHEVRIDDNDFLAFFHKLAYYQDEPLADLVCIPLYYVSKLARDSGVIVIQVGEGNDELFSGYENYHRVLERYKRYWKYFVSIPHPLKAIGYKLLGGFLDIEKRDLMRRGVQNQELFWGGSIAFWETEKQLLLSENLRKRLRELSSFDVVREQVAPLRAANVDYLTQMIYLEFKHRLPELLLMRVDKITMANSIEARVPYLDTNVVEFAMTIPSQLKLKDGEKKYIFKRTVETLLPKEIVYRPKIGFCGSATNMLTERLKHDAKHLFTATSHMNEYFNRAYVEQLFDAAHPGWNRKIWNLVNFTLWYNQWFS